MLHTWLDRPLALAGRVIYKNATGTLKSTLWKHDKPICQIPNLAIHLQTERGRFTWNTDETFRPVFATTVVDKVMTPDRPDDDDTTTSSKPGKKTDPLNVQGPYSQAFAKKHMYSLLKLIATEITASNEDGDTITIDDLVDFDLSFYDTTPPQLVGIHKEFTSCPRLDNLMGTTVATHAMCEFGKEEEIKIPEDATVSILSSFDHEEVGSTSYQGAAGTLPSDTFQRIYNAFPPNKTITAKTVEEYKVCLKKSLFCSADNWHSIHPNYASLL